MNPKQRLKLKTKNEIRNAFRNDFLDPNSIVELHRNYQHNKIDTVLNKYSKDNNSIDQIIDKIEMYRNTKKSLPEEAIAERVKIIP